MSYLLYFCRIHLYTQEMNKIILQGALFCLLIGTGCSSTEPDMPGKEGTLCLAVNTNCSFTRQINESEYTNTNNYTVEVSDTKQLVFSDLFKNIPLEKEMQPGNYTLKAHYGENPNMAFDKMYVEGNTSFTIRKGELTHVNVQCVPANARVRVRTSADFDNFFSNYTVELKTKHISGPFAYAKADIKANKDVYFKADAAGEEIRIELKLTPKNTDDQVGELEQPIVRKLKPRDALTITLKPKSTVVEGGQITGVTITIDDGITDENIDIIIPDEFI